MVKCIFALINNQYLQLTTGLFKWFSLVKIMIVEAIIPINLEMRVKWLK